MGIIGHCDSVGGALGIVPLLGGNLELQVPGAKKGSSSSSRRISSSSSRRSSSSDGDATTTVDDEELQCDKFQRFNNMKCWHFITLCGCHARM